MALYAAYLQHRPSTVALEPVVIRHLIAIGGLDWLVQAETPSHADQTPSHAQETIHGIRAKVKGKEDDQETDRKPDGIREGTIEEMVKRVRRIRAVPGRVWSI